MVSQLGVFEYCIKRSPLRIAEFRNNVFAFLTILGHLEFILGWYQHSSATAKFPVEINTKGSLVGDNIVSLGCLTTDMALKQNSHSDLWDCLESKFLRPLNGNIFM